jgi:hypothetical protein
MLYMKAVSNLMHDVSNESCPSSILNCFIHSEQIHNHNTRHCASNNYYIEYARLTKTNSSFAELEQKYGIIFPLMCVNWEERISIKL